MTDLYRKKVIKGLEICSAGEWNSTDGRDHTDCPYYPAGYTGCTCKLLMRDALTLLREQEPVKPVKEQIFSSIYGWVCGACSFPLLSDSYTYCPKCGRAVKWDI